jgi:cytochrome bd-I ubiquinol oxidase subunit X
MWYFTWILGLGFACAFAALNAMWLELGAPETLDAALPARPVGRTPDTSRR